MHGQNFGRARYRKRENTDDSSRSRVFPSPVPKAPKKRPRIFCEGFREVAIHARTLIAVLRQGPATPVPIPLALGARQRPLSLTHTVDALLPALVE